MTGLSQRRARILRVRAIEHRAAAARQSAADKKIADLLGVARRLGDLRDSLIPTMGPSAGAALQAMNELQSRLADAESSLAQPIRHARELREHAWSVRIAAHGRELGADRLHSKARAQEEYHSALRQDANRPGKAVKERRK